jgi:hypothetical protein
MANTWPGGTGLPQLAQFPFCCASCSSFSGLVEVRFGSRLSGGTEPFPVGGFGSAPLDWDPWLDEPELSVF